MNLSEQDAMRSCRTARRFGMVALLLAVLVEVSFGESDGAGKAEGRTGKLLVVTEPAGAAVSVGIRGVAVSPATFDKLPAGRHKVSVNLRDHRPATFVVDVRAGDIVRTNLVLLSIKEWLKETSKPRVSAWVEELKVGDYESLSRAVFESPPGTRLVVSPGYYEETIILDRPIEIVGDGVADNILIESGSGPCLQMKTTKAIVRGVTFHRREEGAPSPAVDIRSGLLLIERCNISSESLQGIAIRGARTRPRIKACKIRSKTSGGIAFFDAASGVVSECEITDTAGPGMELRDGADPVIQRTLVRDCGQAGVLIRGQSAGKFADCEIAFNRLAGVEIRGGSNPTIQSCKIYEGNGSGLYIHDGGRGAITDCNIYGNTLAGVDVADGADPQIRGCEIHHGHQNGVLVRDGGKGLFEGCSISFNLFAGVEIRDAGAPHLRWCEIQKGFGAGVCVYRGGTGTLELCEVSDNALAGIEVFADASAVIDRCKVFRGMRAGVLLHDGGTGDFLGCDIYQNGAQGVEVREKAAPQFTACSFRRNTYHGIMLHRAGSAILNNCTMKQNGLGSTSVSTDSTLRVDEETP